jgi:lysozyme family protein
MSHDSILDSVIRREGGYVNRADDRGGPTKYGITLATLSTWRHAPVTAADVEALTELEARSIYQSEYIEKPGFNRIDDEPLRDLLVDCAVNHGPPRAIKWLQGALGVAPDGQIGPVTLASLEAAYSWAVYYSVVAERIRFYGRLVSKDKADADKDGISDAGENASGWLNRVAEFVERA